MLKRKSSANINNAVKKISLGNITGIDGSLESVERYEKASQKNKYFEDEMPEYFFVLGKIADDLELSEYVRENYEGDAADGSIETVREIAEKLFNEIKQRIGNTPTENQSKKTKFIKVLIRILQYCSTQT